MLILHETKHMKFWKSVCEFGHAFKSLHEIPFFLVKLTLAQVHTVHSSYLVVITWTEFAGRYTNLWTVCHSWALRTVQRCSVNVYILVWLRVSLLYHSVVASNCVKCFAFIRFRSITEFVASVKLQFTDHLFTVSFVHFLSTQHRNINGN